MPTIEVTPEQAQALANGESITLAPKPTETTYKVVITAQDTVYEFELRDGVPVAHRKLRHGRVKVLASLLRKPLNEWRTITSPTLLAWAKLMCGSGRPSERSQLGVVIDVQRSSADA